MSKQEKLRQKLRSNQKSVSKQDLETLLLNFGFLLDRVTGSHHVYIYKVGDVVYRLVIPFHGQTVKPTYVRWALEILDEIEEKEDEDDDSKDD